MALLWISVLLLLLRWFELGPFADLSWWWVVLPFALCFVWFEVLERVFGLDRRQLDAAEWMKRRRQRVAEQFVRKSPPRR